MFQADLPTRSPGMDPEAYERDVNYEASGLTGSLYTQMDFDTSRTGPGITFTGWLVRSGLDPEALD